MKTEISMLIIALASLGAMGVSVWNTIKISEIHGLINSRLTKLLTLTGKVSRAEGVEEGREERKS